MIQQALKSTIAKKIIFICILTSLIPMTFIAYSTITKSEVELKSSLNEKFYLLTNQIQSEVNQIISKQWLPDMDAIVYALDVNQQMDSRSIQSIIRTVMNKNSDLILLHINSESFAKPQSFFKKNVIDDLNLMDSIGVKSLVESIPSGLIVKDKITFGSAVILNNGEHILLPVDLPFKWGENETGVIRGVFNLSNAFKDMFDNQMSGQGEIYLLSNEGKILFKNSLAKLNTNETFSYPIYEKIEALRLGTARAFQLESFSYNNEQYLGNFVFLQHLNWALVIVDKYEDAYAILNEMLHIMTIWFIIAVILILVLSIIFSKSFVSNIGHLIEASKKIGQGKLDVSISINTKDELKELANSLNHMTRGLKEREKMLRFISQSTASMIAEKESLIGNERKELTVLFSDIRGFTSYSEEREPEEVISMLNTFLSIQTKCVHDFGGEVDKFVGDEIFAIFFGEDHEERASQAAIKMQEQVKIAREASGEPVHVGIGIHRGKAVMGTIGVDERMDHTVLGNTVNIGARLCSAADKDQIIVSEDVKKRLPKSISLIEHSELELKGISKPMQVYKFK